eukprot:CAMPEP_0194369604 /NCGR_PEP_ID=MMETSP0174-20130528/17919_1 /TAXON_ID=216777 /ORGANISM="Proboscia alata, Strain PI-D3" /LENGTH=442 /DNA_ID=CAMNT_0039146649 /DNA_START=91 /DNA_END=1419 /DNA_ORIENTATION=+
MKFSTLNLFLLGSLATVGATARGEAANRRAAVLDYVLTWDGCNKALGDISAADKPNIFCDYTILPFDDTYKVELFGWSGIPGEPCAGTKPDSVAFVGITDTVFDADVTLDPHGTDGQHTSLVASDGEFHTDIDIDRNEFLNGGDEETIHFCMRHDIMEDLDGDSISETSLYFMKTFITVRFFLDGSFELNADSEGRVGANDDVVYTGDDDVLFPNDNLDIGVDDGGSNFNDNLFVNDDPTNGGGVNVTENTTLSEVFDEFNKTYSVFAYQCDLTFPHAQTDDIIYQGDNLGICVETLFRDTFIADVLEVELLQDNNDGGLYTTKPVTGGNPNVVTETDCTLDSRIEEDNSKCFIKTAMLSQFFITQLIVNATGEVDLKIRTTPTNNRRLAESRALQGGIDGSYTVNTQVGARDDVDANTVSGSINFAVGYGMILSMLALSFL